MRPYKQDNSLKHALNRFKAQEVTHSGDKPLPERLCFFATLSTRDGPLSIATVTPHTVEGCFVFIFGSDNR